MFRFFSKTTHKSFSLPQHLLSIGILFFSLLALAGAFFIVREHTTLQTNAAEQLPNVVVYENALGNLWTNWSWDTTVNFTNVESTANPTNKSISITVNKKWGGMYLHTATGIKPQEYSAVQFRVKSTKTGQKFSAEIKAVNDALIGKAVQFTQVGGNPAVNQWRTYTIPFTTFSTRNTKAIGGIVIQDESGMTRHTYLVDDITFIAQPIANTPTQSMPTSTPTAPVTSPSPTISQPETGTPVSINGQLRVCGTKICNQYDKPIQLRGMSSHGIQWFNKCMNAASINALATDWKSDILRVSMYVQEDGYEKDPAGYKTKVDAIVEQAAAQGMYVMLDWHILTPGDPLYNLDRAKEYFTYMAQKHGSKPNMIYEIANEPNGVSWATIKNYSEQIIPVIRAYDPDAIVIVGTRGWSSFGLAEGSNSSEIVANPVNANNIMYSFHFYAASHKDGYRNDLSWAADRIPVFVTEWGTQEYTGDGANDFVSSQAYIDLMASKHISWTNWNYSDDIRAGATFNVGTCPNGPYTGTSTLKPAGVWVKDKIMNPPDNFLTTEEFVDKQLPKRYSIENLVSFELERARAALENIFSKNK